MLVHTCRNGLGITSGLVARSMAAGPRACRGDFMKAYRLLPQSTSRIRQSSFVVNCRTIGSEPLGVLSSPAFSSMVRVRRVERIVRSLRQAGFS